MNKTFTQHNFKKNKRKNLLDSVFALITKNSAGFRATATLVGTTIGAGIFGIPFVVSRIGFWAGIFYLLVLGFLVLLLNLIYGEIILRTPGDHQLTGYSKIYLGKWGKNLATISLFINLYGALLAYLIKIGEFSTLIAGRGNPLMFSLFFFILATIAIFFGLKTVSFFEGLIIFFLLGLIVLIAFLGFQRIEPANFSGINLSFLFLPYGVILFALTGSSIIPEMEEILRKEPQNLKKSIIIGSLIPLFVYLLFTVLIVGICGPFTSDDAISNLPFFLPAWVVNLGALLGILSMGSSYLSLGYVLREIWFRDFRLPKSLAFVLACFPSLIFFMFGAKSFISVLGISGAVAGGLSGILIVSIFERSRRKGERLPAYSLRIPRVLLFILFLIFFIGMVSPFL